MCFEAQQPMREAKAKAAKEAAALEVAAKVAAKAEAKRKVTSNRKGKASSDTRGRSTYQMGQAHGRLYQPTHTSSGSMGHL